MSRRFRPVPKALPQPEQTAPCPPDAAIGMALCEKAAPPRNKAADIVKLEALYVSLGDLPFDIDWSAVRQFRGEVARAIAELRLGR